MKTYQADKEFSELLLKLGFVETTSPRESLKRKRSFKLFKMSGKILCFDDVILEVYKDFHMHDYTIKITEQELKSLLLFFKLSSHDYKEISRDGEFNFEKSLMNLELLKKEFEVLNGLNKPSRRIKKLERILNIYDSIVLR